MTIELINLIVKAIEREGSLQNIKFCNDKKSFGESLTIMNGKIILWYNDKNDSTKLVTL